MAFRWSVTAVSSARRSKYQTRWIISSRSLEAENSRKTPRTGTIHTSPPSHTTAMGTSFDIRTPRRDELPAVVKLIDWNLELPCVEVGYDLDPSGWNVAVGGSGEILGCLASTTLSDGVAMASSLILHKSHRGKGIARALMKASRRKVEEKNVIILALNANLFMKAGFIPKYELHFWQYVKQQSVVPYLMSEKQSTFHVKDLKDVPLYAIRKYDDILYPFDRSYFFENHIIKNCYTGAVAVDNKASDVIGYGTLRRGSETWKIFPLYAESGDVARSLLGKLLQSVPEGDTVMFSPFDANGSAVSILKDIGSIQTVKLTHMYSRSEVSVPVNKIYSVSTHEYSLF